MQLPDKLTPEAERAIVECLILLHRRGVAIRLERERAQLEPQEAEAHQRMPPMDSAVHDVVQESCNALVDEENSTANPERGDNVPQ